MKLIKCHIVHVLKANQRTNKKTPLLSLLGLGAQTGKEAFLEIHAGK